MMIRSVVVSMLSPYETADLWHEAAPGPCSEIRLWLIPYGHTTRQPN